MTDTMTQQEVNALVCKCGHRHDQHAYSNITHTARCNAKVPYGGWITKTGYLTGNFCPCERCEHE